MPTRRAAYRWATDEASFADMKRHDARRPSARLLRADRARHAEGPVGDGRVPYTICDPYLYTLGCWLEGDGVDVATLAEGVGASSAHGASGLRCKKVLAEEKR